MYLCWQCAPEMCAILLQKCVLHLCNACSHHHKLGTKIVHDTTQVASTLNIMPYITDSS
jgi:hypothetical protein